MTDLHSVTDPKENETVAETAADENAKAPEAPAVDAKGRPIDPKTGKPKKSTARNIAEWILTIAAALAIAFVIRTFIFEPVRVDGESMLETLQNNEVMFVTKFDYLVGKPQRFDVVICHYPNRGSTNFVKRVIGLPGDTVSITGGVLTVNDVTYEEEYIVHRPNFDYGPVTVPEGQYIVMGDNRANSHDSRYADVGALDASMIIGHVRSVLFPFSEWRAIE